MSFLKMFAVSLLTVSLVPLSVYATDGDDGYVDNEVADQYSNSSVDSDEMDGAIEKKVEKPTAKAKKVKKHYRKAKNKKKHLKKMKKMKKKKNSKDEL